MSAPPAWCANYVGLPFAEKGRGPAGFDCWGLFRQVRTDRCAEHDLPDYVSTYTSTQDKASVATAVNAGLAAGWKRIAAPQPMCLVILLLAGRPWHCGIMADDVWMLHTTAQTNAVAERIDSLQWRRRIWGFYERS